MGAAVEHGFVIGILRAAECWGIEGARAMSTPVIKAIAAVIKPMRFVAQPCRTPIRYATNPW